MRSRRINRRQQGDLGEASAIEWLTRQGATVSIPLGHSPDYDLIAEIEGRLLRVQAKTTTYRTQTTDGRGRWAVQLATNGGNQSWTGVTKVLDASRCDALFVLTGEGRRWFIPAVFLEGSGSIHLGGSKYSEFEIDRGEPIQSLVYCDRDRSLKSRASRGSSGDGEPGAAVNRMLLAEWVRIPPPPSASDSDKQRIAASSAQTRISANHQVTIPMRSFRAAELHVGDRLRVIPERSGHVVLERIDTPDPGQLRLNSR